MTRLLLAFLQKFSKQTLARQPEMDILMLDRSQNEQYTRDGETGSLAIIGDLIINAILRLSPPTGKALDICCGSASLLCKLASAMPQMQFLGVDLSQNMLEYAQEHRDQYGLKNLTFKQADMYKLNDFIEPPYDLITWHMAMHHCNDQEAVLRVLNQIPQLLKPNGTLFVFDINRPKTSALALMMADTYNRTQGNWYYQDSLDSYKAAFSFQEVEDILKRSHLKNVHHIEPAFMNMFQAFYISQTDKPQASRVANLSYLWQKIDYHMLKMSFSVLPLAKGNQQEPARQAAAHSYANLEQPYFNQINSDILDILNIGMRAMSAYNLQPWRFRVNGDQIFIHLIRHKNFFLKLEGVNYITLGHLLANILEGAKAKSYTVTYEILSEELSLDIPCVKLNFHKNNNPPESISHVLNRTTNRYNYSNQKLSTQLKEELLSLCDDSNIKIHFSEDEEKYKLADILLDLDKIRINNKRLALEATEYIRMGQIQNEMHGNGLEASSIGIGSKEILIFKTIHKFSWLFGILQIAGAANPISQRQRNILNNNGALISFVIYKRSYQNYIKLGMLVQAIANKLAEHELASMPLLSGLYLYDVLNENSEILSSKEKKTILDSHNKMNELLHIDNQRIAYVIRAGYSDKSNPPTIRRNIREMIYCAHQKINPF
ncbi:MAG: methyltransferase domain-containing protein [Candidatus Omnitrophica bacterium]|nr:methyltransferase domain-containing protein [Candidatus Omnitrophota bacterium]